MKKHDTKPTRNPKATPPQGDGVRTTPDADAAAAAGSALSQLEALAAGKADGRVKFDDLGNAVWEWADTPAADPAVPPDAGAPARTARPWLSLAADAPSPIDVVKENPLGVIKGYNPYDSGKLGRPAVPRKKDLRKLSEWVKLRNQFDAKKQGKD